MFNKRPKDTTKKYFWLYLHNALIIIFDVEKASLHAVLAPVFHCQKLFDERESEIGGKGVGTRLLWPFTIPPCLALKSCFL